MSGVKMSVVNIEKNLNRKGQLSPTVRILVPHGTFGFHGTPMENTDLSISKSKNGQSNDIYE